MDLELGASRRQRGCQYYPQSPKYDRPPRAAGGRSGVVVTARPNPDPSQRCQNHARYPAAFLCVDLADGSNGPDGSVQGDGNQPEQRDSNGHAEYDVPQSRRAWSPAGTALSLMGNIAAHTTESVTFSFTVLSGTGLTNGSLITLVVTDRANGALVSHSIAVMIV